MSGDSGPPYLKLTPAQLDAPFEATHGTRWTDHDPAPAPVRKCHSDDSAGQKRAERCPKLPSARKIPAYAIAVSELNATKPPTLKLP